MKKVFIALGVIVVLLVGGVFFVYSNLDAIVESAIETAGTRTLGTDVEVDSVSLDLLGGTASIYGFSIDNPEGFTNVAMASFDELSISIDVQNLSAENIHIFSIVSRSPQVYYETREGTTNFETVTARLGSGEAVEEEEPAGSQPMMRVDSVLIENIRGTLNDDRLPNEVEVALGDISLTNLSGTPDELAQQIMAPILRQVGTAAAQALLRRVREVLQNSEELQSAVDEGRQRVQDAAGETINRLGNLLGGDEEEEN